MKSYDFIIAGGGAAGLGLAYQMAQSSLRGRSILIIDREAKDQNDRTWCFWSVQPTPFDHLVYHRWQRVEVVSDNFQRTYDLYPYTYQMIRAIDYYTGLREALSAVPGIDFMQARIREVTDMQDGSGAAVILANGDHIAARYAFDSVSKPVEYYSGPPRYHYLKQHFKGWEIETPADCFDPSVVTLFDFRTPQKGCMRFFYILPLSPRRALVEYTLFSAQPLKPHEYDKAIDDYLAQVRGITDYRVASVETGVIPMTDRPFQRRLGDRVMAIGTKGGLVKPSSGYAFLRIQNDAAAIVRSLTNLGNPYHVPVSPSRYRLFDRIMLQVMYRQGDLMKTIFTQLFKNNPIQSIFAFLDETAPLTANLRLLTSLPVAPFLKALFRVKFSPKV